MVDVALEARTSVATVSRALNDHGTVDPVLAARVHAAVDKLGYRPNGIARNLRRQRTNLWLLVISDIEVSFFTSLARGVEDVAIEHGQSVALCNVDEDPAKEARYLELALTEHASGVVISPHSAATRVDHLQRAGIPVVVVDRRLDRAVDTVLTDSRGGAHAATEHLLAQGWRHPVCVTGPRSAETAALRRAGYEDALRDAGRSDVRVEHRPFTRDGGRRGATALLDRGATPDAFVVANATLGLGVLEALRDRGLRPGRDVGLVCFDDAPWAPLLEPPISVVRQPGYRVGEWAARLLSDRLADPALAPREIVLDTELVVRESSLRPGRG